MEYFNWEFAEVPTADALPEWNRADDEVKSGDLDLNQPYEELLGELSPCPSNFATPQSTGSAMSGTTDNSDGDQSPWETISPQDIPPPYTDFIWPFEYPAAPTKSLATLPPLLSEDWSLDGSYCDFENTDIAGISLEDSTSTGLGLLFSSNTMTPVSILLPTEATNSAPSTQPPMEIEKPVVLDLEGAHEGDLPMCLNQLCAILRRHYPNSKPPGQLFKHFICRKMELNHCKLCDKALENREQLNQHIMKVHCQHFPFGCDEPGCTHRAVRLADLIKHKEKHSDASWDCAYCGNVLRNKRNLVRHIKKKHPESCEPSRPRSRSIRGTGTN